ncbi:hypothetical protein [Chitinophaga rhizosphaerae]|uniref:hypothetical protein n=1 Tax=Chitinophaga rhizosphaerae TaxID=1864947 RepID=UPI000F7FB510|nr:hypothetical protein [Chitinophaga rhizosphaerae]
MRKIPYLLIGLCLLITLTSRAQVNFQDPIYRYINDGTPVNGVKIITNLDFQDGSQMPTLIFEGYCYGKVAPVGIILNWYIYGGAFYSYKATSFGSYTPVIKLGNENGKVVIYFENKDYHLRFNIRAFAGGTKSKEMLASFQGWSAADGTAAGATNVVTVPYQNSFGGKVMIAAPSTGTSAPAPAAPLHVTNAVMTGSDGISAILGNNHRHFTAFGSINGGRIRGADEGYLVVESNPNGANKTLYLNHESPGNVLIARGGGNVAIGYDASNPSTNPQYKLQVLGTIGARKVKVTQETWADDALRPGYHLPSLPELAAFIRQNGHLPGIPSEKEVKSEGIDVGDMDSRLLRKIEELTLYIIKQDEANAAMRKSLEEMQEKLKKLEKAVDR